MRAELRPSSLGEILDRTAQMYRKYFLLYFGIAAIAYSGVLILSLLANTLLFAQIRSQAKVAGFSVFAGLGIGLISMLPIAIAMAAVIRAVAANYLGQATTIRQAYASIGRRWYRYILILLAMYCYALLPAMALIVIIGAVVGLTHPGFGRNLFVGLMAMLVLAAFLLALLWMLRWLLAVPASLMEDLPVHRSLKRSAALTKGARGRIFVMVLLVGAVMTVIQYAIMIPMFVLLLKSKGVPTLSTQFVGSFGTFFSGSFVLPIYSIALTLFYYDQRIRKEGYDVEWLMEQAAMPVPQQNVSLPSAPEGNPLSVQPERPGPAS